MNSIEFVLFFTVSTLMMMAINSNRSKLMELEDKMKDLDYRLNAVIDFQSGLKKENNNDKSWIDESGRA